MRVRVQRARWTCWRRRRRARRQRRTRVHPHRFGPEIQLPDAHAPGFDPRRQRLSDALARVGRGDRDALREVYDLTAPKLFGVCLRISQDREAAEDILQDVYLKVWHRAGRFDAERGSPITWLCAVARNTAIDWRRAARLPMVDVEHAADIADDRPGAVETIEAGQERALIFHCLDVLGGQSARAIRSAFLDGATYSELADRMKVPLGTMKSWVRRGLQQLKQCMTDG